MREELHGPDELLLDERILDEVQSILKQLSGVRSDLQEDFSCCRRRLKELEEQEHSQK
jgi:hypothetical protein